MDFDLLARQMVRALRGSRSQVAFSRRLGFRSNVAYAWESGRRAPTASEWLRAAQRLGIDVIAAWSRFSPGLPDARIRANPVGEEAVHALLAQLGADLPVSRVASASGLSRFAVGRALRGESSPKLADFLRLVEAMSLRSLDWVAGFVDPASLPAAQARWRRLEAQRRLATERPMTQAVLRALELADYADVGPHREGWIADRLGIDVAEERACLDLLAEAGEVRRAQGRYVVAGELAVDTRRDAASSRRLKRWWAQVGLDRLGEDPDGLWSYNVFTVSEADLAQLRELHRGYFRALRALVAQSSPGERVVVANVQLFALDARTPADQCAVGSSG